MPSLSGRVGVTELNHVWIQRRDSSEGCPCRFSPRLVVEVRVGRLTRPQLVGVEGTLSANDERASLVLDHHGLVPGRVARGEEKTNTDSDLDVAFDDTQTGGRNRRPRGDRVPGDFGGVEFGSLHVDGRLEG